MPCPSPGGHGICLRTEGVGAADPQRDRHDLGAGSIAPFVNHYNGVLLANHGALTVGADLEQAYYRMETVEHTAAIYLNVQRLGGGVELTPEQLAALRTG